VVVLALDDDKHAVRNPPLEQGGDLGPVLFGRDVQFQGASDGPAQSFAREFSLQRPTRIAA
jgi:hypothetical protein